jgi:23S rRNA (uridine2552-2'-O)-methyltransferase
VAVDLQSLQLKKSHRNFTFFQGDVFSREIVDKLQQFAPFNCIISDAAPGTTGNRTIDTERSYNLVEEIITMAKGLLTEGGNLVVKVFQGGDESQLMDLMRKDFAMVKGLKPKACRKESFETYYVGLRKGME